MDSPRRILDGNTFGDVDLRVTHSLAGPLKVAASSETNYGHTARMSCKVEAKEFGSYLCSLELRYVFF
jgi:hypothetical protein